MNFTLKKKDGRARAGEIMVNGRKADTPLFMPVATRGAVRTLISEDLLDLGVQALITNAYHLLIRPGPDIIREAGGLHGFMNWDGIIFTDSGGFQMIRKGFKQDVTRDTVKFRSDYDNSVFELTPRDNINIQTDMGTDVAMCLDYCPSYPADYDNMSVSVENTTHWARECRNVGGNLFGISQGGVEPSLRERSCREIAGIDFEGYALGGLSIGEPREDMYAMLDIADRIYPPEAPRYLMGLGSPVEMLESIGRGIDIFDSAYPTRNARHGSVLTHNGQFDISKARYRTDRSPLDDTCECKVCSGYTRAYVSHLLRAKELSWMKLVTIHNLHFLLELLRNARVAINDNSFDEFKNEFISKYG